MRRIRLAGLLLFAIGTVILIYLGIQFFVLNAKYNSTNSGLELIGFLLGVLGALLYRTQKEKRI
jgi:membrane associated rhomboid family serine protease